MKTLVLSIAWLAVLITIHPVHARQDTIREDFSGICDQMPETSQVYEFDYTGSSGITWSIRTFHRPAAGYIGDDGQVYSGLDEACSLSWNTNKTGYVAGLLMRGIGMLSFQAKSAWNSSGSRAFVLCDGDTVGETPVVSGGTVHSHHFSINRPGPLKLEISNNSNPDEWSGIILDNLSWTEYLSDSVPFRHVSMLKEYETYMDTLESPGDSMDIIYQASGCLMVNNEYASFFGYMDVTEIMAGSVIRLEPNDTMVIRFDGWMKSDASVPDTTYLQVALPFNDFQDTLYFKDGVLDSIHSGELILDNKNAELDLIIFTFNDPGKEYHIRYILEEYEADPTITDTTHLDLFPTLHRPNDPPRVFPNPAGLNVWLTTENEIRAYYLTDIAGRRHQFEIEPVRIGRDLYRIETGDHQRGVYLLSILFTDGTSHHLRVVLE